MIREINAAAIRNVMQGHDARTTYPLPGLRPAAVLVPFYPTPDGLAVVFTKRTAHLDQHSGQISFPGGMQDPDDPDPLTTALRETHEEIGVAPQDVEIWGRLNQEVTSTGFTVAPFVGVMPYPYAFELNRNEVERLIIVPLSHLLNPDFFSESDYPWNGKMYKTYRYAYNDDVIWGATARMLHNLLTLLTTGREPNERFEIN